MIATVWRVWRIGWCVAVVLAAPATLRAQVTADRVAIFRLRDSLARTGDTTSLEDLGVLAGLAHSSDEE